MRIFDKHDKEIHNPDLGKGRFEREQIVVKHHAEMPAVEAVAEVGHYEVVAEYPNGGKDIAWVVDIPGIEAKPAIPAWDEKEEVLRYVEFTEDELVERNKPTLEDRVVELEAALSMILTSALSATQLKKLRNDDKYMEILNKHGIGGA